ncbi:MAG: hypothetical protein PWQ10_667 [Patescibacteria group bacterium]|nr:hypothetical protein [Patescibacteria group bacterium]
MGKREDDQKVKAKPAKQPKSNSQDTQAVGIIMTILGKHDRVVPDIKVIDKYPNIDGHVQIKDEEDYPIGTIAISVKPVNVKRNGLVFDCPVSILAYAAIDPTILLGVDKRTNKIYWMYLDSYELGNINYENNEKTKRVEFETDHLISKSRKEYIRHWTALVDKNRQRLTGYDAKEKELADILKNTNRIVGKRDEKFIQLHAFVDRLNNLLDHDFPTIKKFFYPSAWKIGIAYEKFKENELAYSLYPIHISQNDVQIKEIDNELVNAIRGQGLGFTVMSTKNPIISQPVEYAEALVGEDVMKLVNHKLLKHTGNTVLSREFIFAFLDKFHVQLGIMPDVKDQENVRTINFAFGNYFPIWIEEAYQLLIKEKRNNIAERVARNGYYDPDILGEIRPEELEEIQKKVGNRLNQKSGSYRVANKQLDIGVFIEALSYVTSLDNTGNVDRLYKKANRSRIAKVGSHWIWDKYSKEDAEANLKVVFNNLPAAYEQVVQNNFPTLGHELDLFGKSNIIYIFSDISGKYTQRSDNPTYKMYYFNEPNRKSKAIDFINIEQAKKYDEIIRSSTKRNNVSYEIISASHSNLDFLYHETPLIDLIYELLTTRLREHFEK